MQTKVPIALALLSAAVTPAYAANKGPANGGPMKMCFDYGGMADYKPDGSYDYVVGPPHNSGRWKYLGNHQYQVTFEQHTRVDIYEDMGGGQILDHVASGQPLPGHLWQ